MAHTNPGDLSLRPNPNDPEALELMPAPVHIDPYIPATLHPFRVARATLRTPEEPSVEPYTEAYPYASDPETSEEVDAAIEELLAELPRGVSGHGALSLGAWSVAGTGVVSLLSPPSDGEDAERMDDELFLMAYSFLGAI
jgi:hypothetical protein